MTTSIKSVAVDYTDIANRVQAITGRSVFPSTVEAILKVAATTPQPSADAVRELVERWRELSVKSHRDGQYQGYDTLRLCADELESLLSAASGEKVVG